MADGDGESDTPKVSVVIPTYDRPHFLEKAVRSVIAQTYPNIEIIIVDDHSPVPVDESLTNVDVESRQIVIVRHDENRGANTARRTGIETATGSYIAFLDDDDWFKPEKITRQVEALESSEETVLVYSGQEYRDEQGDRIGIACPSTTGQVTKKILEGTPIGPFSTIMVRRDAIDAAGPPDDRLPSLQDREWILRLSQFGAFDVVNQPLVVRRLHAAGRISDNFSEKRDTTVPLFIQKHRELAASYGWITSRKFKSALYTTLAAAALSAGQYHEARKTASQAVRYYPPNWKAMIYLAIGIGGDIVYDASQTLRRVLANRTHKRLRR